MAGAAARPSGSAWVAVQLGSAFAASPALLAEPDAHVGETELASFRARHGFWLDDFLRDAGEEAIVDQVRFAREWSALRTYARSRGVRLIGDVPIFVARESIDVRARPELFLDGLVGGVPPDYFTAHGQLWGTAVYNWPALRRRGYRWWVERFRRTLELVDLARVDHFRGFVASWTVPDDHRTARHGRWRRGPGAAPFRAAAAQLDSLPLIAEDLGVITPAVERLRNSLGLPGMRVIQFGYGRSPESRHRLENHPEGASSTPGRTTTTPLPGGGRRSAPSARALTGIDPSDPAWGLIRLAFSSQARLAVVPAQDVLGLGSEARMNTPGTSSGNWSWRLEPGQLTSELAARLRAETAAARRLAS